MSRQRSAMKELNDWALHSHIAFNLIDRIQNSLLLGITKAIKLKKREWCPNILMSKFNKSLGAIIEFAELMIVPSRKVLDFGNVPNMVKSRLFKNLPDFVNTTTLNQVKYVWHPHIHNAHAAS